MKLRNSLRILAIVYALTIAVPSAYAETTWLDAPLTSWNVPGMQIPAAPPETEYTLINEPRCRSLVLRSVDTELDQSLADAGWQLFNKPQVVGHTTVIDAMANADGMCRPQDYQSFVFIDGVFAGTVSPVPMTSRTDGAEDEVILEEDGTLHASFRRYSDGDGACCPSSAVLVQYGIDRTDEGVAVVPVARAIIP